MKQSDVSSQLIVGKAGLEPAQHQLYRLSYLPISIYRAGASTQVGGSLCLLSISRCICTFKFMSRPHQTRMTWPAVSHFPAKLKRLAESKTLFDFILRHCLTERDFSPRYHALPMLCVSKLNCTITKHCFTPPCHCFA